SETIEGQVYSFEYALLTDISGEVIPFELEGGAYKPPPELPDFSLVLNGENKFILTDPGGNVTKFSTEGSGRESEYLPKEVSQPGTGPHSTVMSWEFKSPQKRLKTVVAPTSQISPSECTSSPTTTTGCRTLEFVYVSYTTWGGEANYGDRLSEI